MAILEKLTLILLIYTFYINFDRLKFFVNFDILEKPLLILAYYGFLNVNFDILEKPLLIPQYYGFLNVNFDILRILWQFFDKHIFQTVSDYYPKITGLFPNIRES